MIDYSQYNSWEKVTAPTGAVYYVVPDSGLLYSPSQSAVMDRPILYTDPRPALAEKDKQTQREDEIYNMQKDAASPLGQAMPLVGGVAGTVGGAYLIDKIASSPTAVEALPTGQVLMSDGTIKAGTAATTTSAAATPAASLPAASSAATGAPAAVPTSAAAPGAASATAAPGAGMQMLYDVGGPLALAGITAYTGSKTYDAFKAGSGEGAWGGFKKGVKEAGPLNFVPVLGQAAWAGGLLGGLFGHVSTKQKQQQREDSVASENPTYAAFLGQLRDTRSQHPEIKDGYNPAQDKDFVGVDPNTGLWTNNKFATGGSAGGKKYDVANLVADDIRGTPDFVKRYPDWFQKSDEEQRAIAQQALDAGAVSSKKGGIYVDFTKVDQSQNQKTGQQLAARMNDKTGVKK